MKMSAILIAAVALGATAPAFAASQSGSEKPTVTYDAKHDKYCVSQMVTGNILPVKDCRTKKEWAKNGLTIQDPSEEKMASK
ncbi:MAG TPA: hypothetical protein VK533_06525 [Sphingomonas sp.]|uniref:hypothetical protein n=1 Tax=Sphingomonas sp. TaxID=28214 RepID=UPI002C0CFD24|nr:hypothetical protein [Sphingomonas sp.]HMI19180.1 hypothetical protein [Sphingomonas sp.]